MGDLESRVRRLEGAFAEFSAELRLALHYIHLDAASSLTKSRMVLEKLLCRLYQAEMGQEPRKPLLGDMLNDNQFTRKLERRILSRMNAIRDMGNLGPHGEPVQPSDAARVLDDLCEVLDWHRARGAAPPAPDELKRHAPAPRYEYLLPVFVGHPSEADHTGPLREAVELACQQVNREQEDSRKPFLCVPQFVDRLDHSNLATVLEMIRESIRQSALAIFEVSQKTSVNVFLELGVAIGMNRPAVLLGRKPYDPPSDLRGYRAVEYSGEKDLQNQLVNLLKVRIRELSRPPSIEQHLVHQKMQIDAIWQHRAEWAENAILFLAGDLSWGATLEETLRRKAREGVAIRVCCKRPRGAEALKWGNIRRLQETGVEIKLYDEVVDPGLRGFIWEPSHPTRSEAVFVDKERRRGSRTDFESSGVTIGESEYLYTATIYNGQSHPRFITAVLRLFESMWERARVEDSQTSP
jgi:hypothetical protein